MVGKVKSIDAINGTLFEFSEESTLSFLVANVVGEALVVGDMADFDISWSGTTRSVTNIRKKS